MQQILASEERNKSKRAALSLRKKSPYSDLFWSVFFPDFPTFGLNTEKYFSVSRVSLRIQSEYRKIREKCGPE